MLSARIYLTKSDLTLELAKVAAVFPYFKATDLTWEVYWEDLRYIPAEKLLKGFVQCRTSREFFPSVHEIIKASIGNDYGVVEWTPHRPATIEDIIRVYKKEHRIEMILLEDEKKKKEKQLPDGTKD